MTAEELYGLLEYDPHTGIFRNRVFRGPKAPAGGIAGSFDVEGYGQIGIAGKVYRSHRLAWLFMTGEWPEYEIDHIDGDPANNRWINLRAATRTQNMQNQRGHRDSATGVKGITFEPSRNKWKAAIRANGKTINLGRYSTPEAAHAAYKQAAAQLFGSYALQ